MNRDHIQNSPSYVSFDAGHEVMFVTSNVRKAVHKYFTFKGKERCN